MSLLGLPIYAQIDPDPDPIMCDIHKKTFLIHGSSFQVVLCSPMDIHISIYFASIKQNFY